MKALTHILFGLVIGLLMPLEAADFMSVRVVLQAHCVKCHGPEKSKGQIDFTQFKDQPAALIADEVWERMSEVLAAGEMPPKGEAPLDAHAKETLLEWYRATFKAVTEPVPGPASVRRLTRREYQNSLEDLLGIRLHQQLAKDGFRYMKPPPTIVEKLLPADPPGASGFNNDASVLSFDAAAVVKHLSIAQYAVGQLDSVKGARELVFGSDTKAAPILKRFARRAFRRQVTDSGLAAYLRISEERLEAGESLDRAVKDAVAAMLTSSKFLFRVEQNRPEAKATWRVDDFELATRLSYFLWSSTPDEELLQAAEQGKLQQDAELRRQVARMLRSPKVRELSRNFAGQWLGFEEVIDPHIIGVGGNRAVRARLAMYDEALLFFEYLVRENRPLLEVVNAEKSFINKQLAGVYGVKGFRSPVQKRFRGREDAPDPLILWPLNDPRRGGYLTMAATAAITSAPQRTSPIRRGVWVLDKILGTPVSEPPPVVPALVNTAPGTRQPLSVREQLELHTAKAECRTCHQHIDPLGLGLETIGPMGRYRTVKYDVAGTLPSGQSFKTLPELKQILATEFRAEIRRNIASRMLAYALGRRVRYFDEPVLRQLITQLEEGGDSFHVLINGIVLSVPFRYRAPSTTSVVRPQKP